ALTGAPLGSVIATDPEGEELQYALSGGDGAFKIDAKTGLISVADRTRLQGKQRFDLVAKATEVKAPEDSDPALSVEVDVKVDVLPTPTAAPPEDYSTPHPEIQPQQVSHAGELILNPPAFLANYSGASYELTYKVGEKSLTVGYSPTDVGYNQLSTQPITLSLGTLSVIQSGPLAGTLKFDPWDNLVERGLLKDKDEAGGYYYADQTIEYEISGVIDGKFVTEKHNQVIRVTNSLPVFRSEYVARRNNRFVLDDTILVLRDETYRIDLDELFYDPDEDPLTVSGFQSTNHNINSADGSGQGNQEEKIETVFGYMQRTNSNYEVYRSIFLLQSQDSSSVVVYQDGESSDISINSNFYTNAYAARFTYVVLVSDGQPGDASTQFEIVVAPWNGNPSSAPFEPTTMPWIEVLRQASDPGIDALKPDSWTLSASDNQAGREGANLQVVGDALVDLVTGDVQRRHALVLDGSGGASELALPGLVYDSAVADPRPIIEATLRPKKGLATGAIDKITATFTWYDHANAVDLSGYAAPRKLVSEVTYTSIPDAPEGWAFAFEPAEAPRVSGVYDWDIQFELSIGGEKLTLKEFGQTAVVVHKKIGSGELNDGAPANFDYTPMFGNGWALEGAPYLYVDDVRGRKMPSTGAQDLVNDDYLILWFPGQTPRVFSAEGLADQETERRSYAAGTFTAIDLVTGLEDPLEFGVLRSLESGDIIYTDASGIAYRFEKVSTYASSDFYWPAPGWRLVKISSSASHNPVTFGYDNAEPLKLSSITATDGRVTNFTVPSDNYELKYSTPDSSPVSFDIQDSQLKEIKHSGAQIRRFEYLDDSRARLKSDKWVGASLERTTLFEYA
ncbi:MAG: cadherin repeat domain-containing protein, partial [Planctomycetales bacterium]|nr:cadherin repeat domain-containing protein [Planctomycetales bacterium]